MAWIAVHNKTADDEYFTDFLKAINAGSEDERNYVKKAVSWALRNIGKRNTALNKKAIKISEGLLKRNNKSVKWIARDAIRELSSEKIQKRLNKSFY